MKILRLPSDKQDDNQGNTYLRPVKTVNCFIKYDKRIIDDDT